MTLVPRTRMVLCALGSIQFCARNIYHYSCCCWVLKNPWKSGIERKGSIWVRGRERNKCEDLKERRRGWNATEDCTVERTGRTFRTEREWVEYSKKEREKGGDRLAPFLTLALFYLPHLHSNLSFGENRLVLSEHTSILPHTPLRSFSSSLSHVRFFHMLSPVCMLKVLLLLVLLIHTCDHK